MCVASSSQYKGAWSSMIPYHTLTWFTHVSCIHRSSKTTHGDIQQQSCFFFKCFFSMYNSLTVVDTARASLFELEFVVWMAGCDCCRTVNDAWIVPKCDSCISNLHHAFDCHCFTGSAEILNRGYVLCFAWQHAQIARSCSQYSLCSKHIAMEKNSNIARISEQAEFSDAWYDMVWISMIGIHHGAAKEVPTQLSQWWVVSMLRMVRSRKSGTWERTAACYIIREMAGESYIDRVEFFCYLSKRATMS